MELVTCFLVLSFKEIVNDVIVGLATFCGYGRVHHELNFLIIARGSFS